MLNTKGEDSEKSMTDLSQLIMEKLKFLSNSRDDVAPVQVMAIQIEVRIIYYCSRLGLKMTLHFRDQ